METEEQIVYQLLEVIRASYINNDESIDEREIRSYMRSERAQLLYKTFLEGTIIPDNVFQDLGALVVPSHVDPNDPTKYILDPLSIKPLINFRSHNGLIIWSYDVANSLPHKKLAIVDYDYFLFNKEHPVYKNQSIASYKNNKIYLYPGIIGNSDISLNNATKLNADNLLLVDKQGSGGAAIKVQVEAVLLNPDDGLNYDWTLTPYPFPSELLLQLKKNILRNEFNIILQTKSDNINNMNNELNEGSAKK